MKGIKRFLFLTIMMLFITACSTEAPNDEKNNSTDQTNDDIVQEEVYDQDNNNGTDKAENEQDNYPELSYISEKIDIDRYDLIVETDNQGSRVLFFTLDNKKYYKSVYIIEEQRLKLLDIDQGGEPLINGIINE
ncbi:hypothetical protein [Paraliobacillus sediminis]|uniref:hypothetical protein n=1 Tax=Paraliobacillus sediminis TaxID=1885916 RepID=UPI000E3D9576|nr:hypothetical protein [Paraliobacillus sediminis]